MGRVINYYLARFEPEPAAGGYSVSFPDLPEAFTGGDDLEDALAQASDCLGETLSARMHDREEIPAPSGVASSGGSGLRRVAVPLDLAPKVAVYMAKLIEGVTVRENITYSALRGAPRWLQVSPYRWERVTDQWIAANRGIVEDGGFRCLTCEGPRWRSES